MKDKMSEARDLFAAYYKPKSSKLLKLLMDTFNINYFSYQRIYQDGRYIIYINNFDYFDYFIKKNIYQNDAFLVAPSHGSPGKSIHLFDSSLDQIDLPIIEDLKEIQKIFKYRQSVLIKRNYPGYYEIYVFSIPQKPRHYLNGLLSQLSWLEKFIVYFHKEFKEELAGIESLNINIQEIIGNQFKNQMPFENPINPDKLDTFWQAINPTEYQLKNSVGQLTNREKECLFWLIQGKSAQETGEILSISRRTVETLRENCRLRFGTHYTFSNLIYLLGKYDLF